MARRRLSRDVSTSEMLRLREEQKMSVKEIAKSLDVSPQTVYRYIGPEPKKERPPKAQQGAVGRAMVKAFNAKYTQEPKRSIQNCKSCSNRGVACSFCLRNPMLKDYYQKGE